MFVRKSHHESEVKRLAYEYSRLDAEFAAYRKTADAGLDIARIQVAGLQGHIEDLKRLIFIPKGDDSKESFEADAVISCRETPSEQSDEDKAVAREFDLILSGMYDTVIQ